MTDDFTPRSRADFAWRSRTATARAAAGPTSGGKAWTADQRRQYLDSLGPDGPADDDGPRIFGQLEEAERRLAGLEDDLADADISYRVEFTARSTTRDGRPRSISDEGWRAVTPLQRARDQLAGQVEQARARRSRLLADLDQLYDAARNENQAGW